jgi:hypothetical protein
MPYRGCPHCGKTIDAASRNCIHCDRDIYDVTPQWFCTSCGATTNPVSLSRFSFWIFVILCLIMVLPGLLYMVYWLVAGKTGCPQCRKPTLIPINSPVARAAIAAHDAPR